MGFLPFLFFFFISRAEELISDAVLVTLALCFINESADDHLAALRLSEVPAE